MKLADVDKVVRLKSLLVTINALVQRARSFPDREVINNLLKYISQEALISCLINLAIIEMSTLLGDLKDLGIDEEDINALMQEYNLESVPRNA